MLVAWRAGTQHDVARLGAGERRIVQAVDESQGLGDARLQLGKTLLVVFVRRHLDIRQARADALGEVRGDLHLARQRKHVWKQARLQQHGRIEAARRRVCFGLGEQIRKTP